MRNILTLLLVSLFTLSCTVQQYYVIKTHATKKKKPKLDPVYDSAVILMSSGRSASGSIVRIIDKNTSYVITVKHFCNGIKGNIDVAAAPHQSDKIIKFKGKIDRVHKFLDMCLVRLEGDTSLVRPIKFRNKKPYVGMQLYTLGAPAGLWPSKNAGYLTGVSKSSVSPPELKEPDILAVSVPSFYGSSGSPIYDRRGRMVGMIIAVNIKFHHNSIGIPAHLISDFLSHALQK